MKRFLIQCGLFCVAAMPAGGQELDRTGVATNIRALESLRFDAQQRKDVGALNSIFDNALMLVDENGSLWTKADVLSNSHDSEIVLLRIVPKSLTVRVNGGVATAIGIYEQRRLKAGHTQIQRCRFIDTWVFKEGKWLCVASTATSVFS
jgi:hypothetical protein